jgi:hypothetical protein
MISLPLAMAVTFLARPLVFIVGGAQYLDVPGVFTIFGQTIPYMGGADLAFPGDHLEHPHRLCQQRDPVRADRREPAAFPDARLCARRGLQHRGQPDPDPQAGLCGRGDWRRS